MARQFKPLRFFVLMALLVFIACGVTAFYSHRAEHGRTPDERTAYATGEAAGEQAAPGAKMPYASDMNGMAEQYLKKEGKIENPMPWKTAFGHGYEEGFKKTHP